MATRTKRVAVRSSDERVNSGVHAPLVAPRDNPAARNAAVLSSALGLGAQVYDAEMQKRQQEDFETAVQATETGAVRLNRNGQVVDPEGNVMAEGSDAYVYGVERTSRRRDALEYAAAMQTEYQESFDKRADIGALDAWITEKASVYSGLTPEEYGDIRGILQNTRSSLLNAHLTAQMKEQDDRLIDDSTVEYAHILGEADEANRASAHEEFRERLLGLTGDKDVVNDVMAGAAIGAALDNSDPQFIDRLPEQLRTNPKYSQELSIARTKAVNQASQEDQKVRHQDVLQHKVDVESYLDGGGVLTRRQVAEMRARTEKDEAGRQDWTDEYFLARLGQSAANYHAELNREAVGMIDFSNPLWRLGTSTDLSDADIQDNFDAQVGAIWADETTTPEQKMAATVDLSHSAGMTPKRWEDQLQSVATTREGLVGSSALYAEIAAIDPDLARRTAGTEQAARLDAYRFLSNAAGDEHAAEVILGTDFKAPARALSHDEQMDVVDDLDTFEDAANFGYLARDAKRLAQLYEKWGLSPEDARKSAVSVIESGYTMVGRTAVPNSHVIDEEALDKASTALCTLVAEENPEVDPRDLVLVPVSSGGRDNYQYKIVDSEAPHISYEVAGEFTVNIRDLQREGRATLDVERAAQLKRDRAERDKKKARVTDQMTDYYISLGLPREQARQQAERHANRDTFGSISQGLRDAYKAVQPAEGHRPASHGTRF